MIKRCFFLLLSMAFLFKFVAVHAQDMDYRFQTVFIYNFTKYMQWKNTPDNSFTIGVIGQSPIKQELLKMAATKKVGNKRIVVKTFKNARDIQPCQMVYVPRQASSQINAVLAKAQSLNSLVVTEAPGLAKKGSNINFIKESGRWKFELNRSTTKAAGIRVSSQLERLAEVVN